MKLIGYKVEGANIYFNSSDELRYIREAIDTELGKIAVDKSLWGKRITLENAKEIIKNILDNWT